MGGNPDGSRDTTANTICACRGHHQGVKSLHSGHLKWTCVSEEDGANGPMIFHFHEKLPKAELWTPEVRWASLTAPGCWNWRS